MLLLWHQQIFGPTIKVFKNFNIRVSLEIIWILTSHRGKKAKHPQSTLQAWDKWFLANPFHIVTMHVIHSSLIKFLHIK